MGFTKAQRLKGLKKQLRNLGYDVVTKEHAPLEQDIPADDVPAGKRGEHTLARMRAQQDEGGF